MNVSLCCSVVAPVTDGTQRSQKDDATAGMSDSAFLSTAPSPLVHQIAKSVRHLLMVLLDIQFLDKHGSLSAEGLKCSVATVIELSVRF